MPASNNQLVINKYLINLNKELSENENFFYVFRGQAQSDWKLNCTAARTKGKHSDVLIKYNQEKLINDCTIRGFKYSREKQKSLHDLELLADLRHHGTPSLLIDFTSDFLIALWFACESEKDKDGKIFILNCYDTSRFSMVSSETIEKPVSYFFEGKPQKLWYWVPERLNQRLTDQDAVFVFGETSIKECKSIQVKKEDKDIILQELEKFFDYSKKTLFSDKYAIGEVYKDADEPENLLEESIHHIQTRKFLKAKELIKQIVEIDQLKFKKPELFSELKFQLYFVEIELMKEDIEKTEEDIRSNGKDKSEIEKLLDSCRQKLSNDKSFRYCIDQEYKVDKIKTIKNKFKQALDGFIPPEEEPSECKS